MSRRDGSDYLAYPLEKVYARVGGDCCLTFHNTDDFSEIYRVDTKEWSKTGDDQTYWDVFHLGLGLVALAPTDEPYGIPVFDFRRKLFLGYLQENLNTNSVGSFAPFPTQESLNSSAASIHPHVASYGNEEAVLPREACADKDAPPAVSVDESGLDTQDVLPLSDFVSTSRDETVALWDVSKWRVRRRFGNEPHSSDRTSQGRKPGFFTGRAKELEKAKGDATKLKERRVEETVAAAAVHFHKWLLVSEWHSGVCTHAFDVVSGDRVFTFEHGAAIWRVVVDQERLTAYTGGSESNVKMWDLKSRTHVRTFDNEDSIVDYIIMLPDHQGQLAVLGANGDCSIIDPRATKKDGKAVWFQGLPKADGNAFGLCRIGLTDDFICCANETDQVAKWHISGKLLLRKDAGEAQNWNICHLGMDPCRPCDHFHALDLKEREERLGYLVDVAFAEGGDPEGISYGQVTVQTKGKTLQFFRSYLVAALS